MQTLTYPLAIYSSKNEQILHTLFFFRHVINFYLRQFAREEVLEGLDDQGFAYKCLESRAFQKRYYLPSRIHRGVLELVGRCLRTLKDRRALYALLHTLEADPEKWDDHLLREKHGVYRKSHYVENLKEQALHYLETHKSLPADYLEFAKTPQLSRGMISYAPDDGQAFKLEVADHTLHVCLKGLTQAFPRQRSDWEWIDFSVALPDRVTQTAFTLASPDLRVCVLRGKRVPVLDFKIKVEASAQSTSKNFVTVDWGIHKLVTLCVFNEEGQQISRPFFLKCDAIQKKLLRIRQEIDHLKAQRAKWPKGSTKAKWYSREIAKRWHKFRQIQKQLAHLASNVIVEMAKLYNCSKIYVEGLGSLKSRFKSRTLNWKLNSTVRHQIYEKVAYKAKLAGISLEKPLHPAWTSQFCPKCGKRGHHVQASDRLEEPKKGGGWFYCPSCGYNADRDYVACQNLARKALFGEKLKGLSKAFVYTAKGISDPLFRQSISPCERLRYSLNGWKNSVFLRPVYLVAGTLRV